MPELVQGAKGEVSYDVAFKAGQLQVSAKYQGAQAGAGFTSYVSASALVQALADKLTNPTEKALLEGLEAIISSIP